MWEFFYYKKLDYRVYINKSFRHHFVNNNFIKKII